MALNKELLHFFLENALRSYSDDFRVQDTSNPVKFLLNHKKYSAHISYVHDSGENRSNDDEARIQLQRATIDRQRENVEQGYAPVFIGFYEKGQAFVAWDPNYIFSLGFAETGSVYARKSHSAIVNERGGALRRQAAKNFGGDTTVLALASNALGVYLENIDLFHKIEDEGELQAFLNAFPTFVDGSTKYSEDIIEYDFSAAGKREKKTIVSKRVAYPRNPKFSKIVLSAYGSACAVCSKQLGIVQAAHIVPHSHDKCVDTVRNGIALCVEHHALYDNGLLMPHRARKLYLNDKRVEFLTEIGQTNGLDEIKERIKHDYTVPTDEKHHPDEGFLDLALRIRLGTEN